MSDVSQGPGWWLAADSRWYPPEQHPDFVAQAASDPSMVQAPQSESISPSQLDPGVRPPSPARFCISCGTALPSAAAFCPQCGKTTMAGEVPGVASVTVPTAPSPLPPSPPKNGNDSVRRPYRKRWWIWATTSGIVIVVAAIATLGIEKTLGAGVASYNASYAIGLTQGSAKTTNGQAPGNGQGIGAWCQSLAGQFKDGQGQSLDPAGFRQGCSKGYSSVMQPSEATTTQPPNPTSTWYQATGQSEITTLGNDSGAVETAASAFAARTGTYSDYQAACSTLARDAQTALNGPPPPGALESIWSKALTELVTGGNDCVNSNFAGAEAELQAGGQTMAIFTQGIAASP